MGIHYSRQRHGETRMTITEDDLIEMFGLEWIDFVEYLEDE
jgi:hypothetical protein